MKEFLNIEEEVIYHKLMPDRLQQGNTSSEMLNAIDLSNCAEIMDTDQITRSISELGKQIIILKETSENYAFRPLYSNSRVFGKGIVFARRVVRKLLKWYIEPICFQQTVFNNAVTRSIEQIAKIQTELIVSVSELASIVKCDDAEAASKGAVLQETSSTDEPQKTSKHIT